MIAEGSFRRWTASAPLALLLLTHCGGSAPPPRHSLADEPTPSLPQYTPRPAAAPSAPRAATPVPIEAAAPAEAPGPASATPTASPCDLDRYRWQVTGGGCPRAQWTFTPQPDGTLVAAEHGCDNIRGTAAVIAGGDVRAETGGSGWAIALLLQTSKGNCERIPTLFTCLPGSRCAGTGEIAFVRIGPR